MADEISTLDMLDAVSKKRTERRAFFRKSGGFAVGLAGGAILSACGSGKSAEAQFPCPTPPAATGPTDAEILNFALNLEYLEAQFYLFAATGVGLTAADLTGVGTAGAVTGGRAVNFTDPVVRQYANEIAADELAHVRFLRRNLGAAAVAQPALDIGVTPTSAFSNAARAAGLIGAGASFDAYATDENFLLAAYIFEDVGVTAYKGAAPLIDSPAFLEAAAGILAAEAYHAGLVRTVLYAKGLATPSLRTSADAISNARDSLDGTTGMMPDRDQGISPTGTGNAAQSNIVPLDPDGLAYSRSPGQVLNIAYLTPTATNRGGFFPAGVNGALMMSAAS